MADGEKKGHRHWIEISQVVAMPIVTLVVGYLLNSSISTSQTRDSNLRLYLAILRDVHNLTRRGRPDAGYTLLQNRWTSWRKVIGPMPEVRTSRSRSINSSVKPYPSRSVAQCRPSGGGYSRGAARSPAARSRGALGTAPAY